MGQPHQARTHKLTPSVFRLHVFIPKYHVSTSVVLDCLSARLLAQSPGIDEVCTTGAAWERTACSVDHHVNGTTLINGSEDFSLSVHH